MSSLCWACEVGQAQQPAGRRCRAHLVRVQQGVANDVLTDVGSGGQAVQAVEELYTGDVMFTRLLVQLIPEHTGHPLQGEGRAQE